MNSIINNESKKESVFAGIVTKDIQNPDSLIATSDKKKLHITKNITDKKTGEIIGAINVADTDEIVCITSQGKSLRVAANSVAKQGRGASGVKVFNIDPPDIVIGLDRVPSDENEG